MQAFTNPFPLATSSLIHCITNEISCEMLANGILALGCKPVMADDPREVLDFTKQSQALFINLGHLSAEKEKAIREVRSEIADLSIAIAEKVMKEKISRDKEQQQIIDRLLDEVSFCKS